MNIDNILDEIIAHGQAEYPREACGVVVIFKGRQKYIPCKNICNTPTDFIIDPEDYAKAEELGEPVLIVHSHPQSAPEPSVTDLLGIEYTQLPWMIYHPETKEYTITEPSGYTAPLIGRPFIHGVLDCYSIIKDYYKQILNIDIPNYHRDENWWMLGQDIYLQNYESAGFTRLIDQPLQAHDVVLMQLNSTTTNHGGVITENGELIHHATGRLSSKDMYSQYYRHITTHHLRYKDFL